MGKKWDTVSTTSGVIEEADEEAITSEDNHAMEAFHIAWLREAYRILKPGGIAKVFAATRTMHRLAAAMESVGFVLEPGNDLAAWAYGSGFPKSLNLGKSIDAYIKNQREREVIEALKARGFDQVVWSTDHE